MAHRLNYEAIEIKQPGLKKGQSVYIVSIPVKDLIDTSIFKVDFWKKELIGTKEQGYQRVINERHASGISTFLKNEDAVLPTSVLISTRSHTPDFEKGCLVVDKFPLFIVDGQHRVAGLRMAVENGGLSDWESATLPAIILSGFSKFEEMIQFVEMNTKQKKVETDLALQLMYDMSTEDSRWNDKFVSEGNDWKVRAIKLVNRLNEVGDSPWYQSIKIAGENIKSIKKISSSNSFATSLKPLVKGVFEYNRGVDINVRILSNFWLAIRELFTDAFLNPRDYAIQKTPGLFSLHSLLQAILSKEGYEFGLEKNKMKKLIAEVMDESEIEVDFWRSDRADGVTMYGSMKGFRLLTDRFIEALNKVDKVAVR